MIDSLKDEFLLYSQLLHDVLTIKIALPDEYHEYPNRMFPSIYLLDAAYFFDEAPGILDEYLVRGEGMANIVHSLTQQGKLPATVLIGIGYTEEQRSRFTLDEPDRFYEFFRKELIPAMESRYRVGLSSLDRLLFGYSGSAHFSTYALFADIANQVETFHQLISISGVYFPELATTQLEEKCSLEYGSLSFSGRKLYLAIGEDDPKTELLERHREFSTKLVSRNYQDLVLFTCEFPGKGHYDIPEFAFREALLQLSSS